MKSVAQMAAESDRLNAEDRKESIIMDNHIKAVLDTAAGREVLKEVLSFCNLYTVNLDADNKAFIQAGQRSVGLQIIDFIGQHNYIKLLGD